MWDYELRSYNHSHNLSNPAHEEEEMKVLYITAVLFYIRTLLIESDISDSIWSSLSFFNQ